MFQIDDNNNWQNILHKRIQNVLINDFYCFTNNPLIFLQNNDITVANSLQDYWKYLRQPFS